MLKANELELRANLSLGTLESNAEQIKGFVMQRLQDYTPANYVGRVSEAKADRAVLNNAEKTLNAKRLELERAYLEPFNAFKAIITDTCKAIKQASGQLDDIVKQEENREREEKKTEIQEYWDSKNFSLFPLEKIFDDRWLNKGAKIKDVQKEIDERIEKVFADLKILDRFPAQDIPLIKTIYIDTLDITQAMQKAQALNDNRERLAKEAVEREEMERRARLEEQRKEEKQEQKAVTARMESASLVDEIFQEKAAEQYEEYACVFKGRPRDLVNMKEWMTKAGITYEKLQDKGNGVYSK